MKHSVRHDIDIDLARKATDRALQSYKERFPEFKPQVRWTTDRLAEVEFSAKGMSMTGKFELTASEVIMDMQVPLMFKFFRKKAIDVVEREILKWISKARQGEFDEPTEDADA